MEEKKKQSIEIQLSEKEALGTFCNQVLVTHSGTEFIIDFLALMPGLPKACIVKRIIMTPEHIKQLHRVLENNIKNYEKNYGSIKSKQKQPAVPTIFRGPMPEA